MNLNRTATDSDRIDRIIRISFYDPRQSCSSCPFLCLILIRSDLARESEMLVMCQVPLLHGVSCGALIDCENLPGYGDLAGARAPGRVLVYGIADRPVAAPAAT